ncbi:MULTISPECIES: inorganic phosphate transporter [unclassified Nocardioides]|uniref:inorganic phosphate transporter n=1 Tax=unclassified Nocardioides TaxID=2615069 RepID=UPI0006FFE48C|nr:MULTISPECIES: inorganic phosphate transporter [unclassified Nocardioides]KRA38589.1 inorganic phosphate transporter [Nocardioides sp. Root614]KRA92549.1 inorganic phosphate transporter [Nocardioides sp. Root682]
MSLTLAIVIAVVVIALAFDYTNGFHDAANAIATSVSTRALTPRIALTLAAIMNFLGALLGQEVAKTVADVISIEDKTGTLLVGVHHGLVVVMAGLLGAIIWNLITWYYGLPSSSSHALIGGLVGAAIAGGVAVKWDVIVQKVLIPMVISPLFGFSAAFVVMTAIMWIFRKGNPHKINRGFRGMQTVSAAALALGHGLQDAQKTMGVILLTLVIAYPASYNIETLPIWVVLLAAGAISAGTYAGGWRIMRTLGRKIIDLDPPRGFAAESVGATVLYTTAFVFHAPISTTHTITSAVMGAGATKRFNAVKWGMARTILTAWVSTFPAAALASWGCYEVLSLILL